MIQIKQFKKKKKKERESCNYNNLHQVPAEPDGGEMAPAQLAHDMVSIVKEIANFHRMVTTWKKYINK